MCFQAEAPTPTAQMANRNETHQARYSNRSTMTNPAIPNKHHQAPTQPQSAVHDLLPFCTIGAPLNEAQVIALSDVVGSMKELALLCLCAASGDQRSVSKLANAVGSDVAINIVEFFTEEWEVHG